LAGTKEHAQHLGQEARIGSIFVIRGHQRSTGLSAHFSL
jgi:hypothetical protein